MMVINLDDFDKEMPEQGHGNQKLSRDQLQQMFVMKDDGKSNTSIAKHFGVSRSYVWLVFHGQRRFVDGLLTRVTKGMD